MWAPQQERTSFCGWCSANEFPLSAFLSFCPPAAAAYLFQRQLSPTPAYPSQYQLYAMENTRQTILNDYITSQQMQVNLRPDVARGLSPREQQLGLPYPATRGACLCLRVSHDALGVPSIDEYLLSERWNERRGSPVLASVACSPRGRTENASRRGVSENTAVTKLPEVLVLSVCCLLICPCSEVTRMGHRMS